MSTETTQAETPAESTPRTFYHSDYRKFCDLLKSMRHVHCDTSTAKPAASQEWIEQLADAAAQVFLAESVVSGKEFNVGRFLKDTQLPQAAETVSVMSSAFDGKAELEPEDESDEFALGMTEYPNTSDDE